MAPEKPFIHHRFKRLGDALRSKKDTRPIFKHDVVIDIYRRFFTAVLDDVMGRTVFDKVKNSERSRRAVDTAKNRCESGYAHFVLGQITEADYGRIFVSEIVRLARAFERAGVSKNGVRKFMQTLEREIKTKSKDQLGRFISEKLKEGLQEKKISKSQIWH